LNDQRDCRRSKSEARVKKISAVIVAFGLIATSAVAQTPSQSAASKADLLSLDQKVKISKLITKQTEPLANPSFSIVVGGMVPAEIPLHSLPADAEKLAPQVRGFGYIVVEELIALVDQGTRKVEIARLNRKISEIRHRVKVSNFEVWSRRF
jgi:hypothetical protein